MTEERGCDIKGCVRKHKGHGFCKIHYWRWYRKQEVDDPKRQCVVGYCRRIRDIQRRCTSHYTAVRNRAKRADSWPLTDEQWAKQDELDRAKLTPGWYGEQLAKRYREQFTV